ncbi:unnamed protein product, partial [Heterobilharzia americana]
DTLNNVNKHCILDSLDSIIPHLLNAYVTSDFTHSAYLHSVYIETMSTTDDLKSEGDSSVDPIDWENMVNHPAFAAEIDPTSSLHPATEALQALKFESEDPDANALSYKEEGNYYYQRKDFSKAITSYTAGLRAKSSHSKLNAILYTNRALSHFCIQNYRSCINDFDCQENDLNCAYEILKSRGINVNHKLEPIDFPETSYSKFYVDSLGKLHWPILFMYPEFGQTDFLRDVIESSTVIDCLKLVFDVNQPPPSWDPDVCIRLWITHLRFISRTTKSRN